jgi:membrane-associated protease RseP (regulator of RpoE activity)
MRQLVIVVGCVVSLWSWPARAAETTPGQYVGVGIRFAVHDGGAFVTKTVDGSPAHQAGIQAGDQIVAVDGVPVPKSVVDGDLGKSLHGEEGSTVSLSIKRAGTSEALQFSMRRVAIACPTYSNRYVNGTFVWIGQYKGLEVRMAAWKAGDLQITLYLTNDTEEPITFDPEQVTVDAIQKQKDTFKRTRVKTFSADAYERKLQNSLAWQSFFVAMGNVQVPQPETYNISGSSNTNANDWSSGASASARTNYSGTVTRQPTLAEQQAAQDRAAARTERTMAPARAQAAAATSGLMRIQTLDPHTTYGGVVYVKSKGDDYSVTVPFGSTDFDFPMSFKH